MKIYPQQSSLAINGRFLSQPATGVQRYAHELINGWDRMLQNGEIDPRQYQLEILIPPLTKPNNTYQHIPIRQVGRLQGNLWEQLELPLHSRRKWLFNPGNISPIMKLNQIVTIHDASVFATPYSYSRSFLMKYRLVYKVLAKTAKLILTVSDFSKTELIKYCHIDPQRLVVIPEGSDHILRIEPDQGVFEKHNLGKNPYLLTVGTNAPHKNLKIIYQAAEKLSAQALDFVVVGSDFDRWFNAPQITSSDRIKKLGFLSDAELKAVYQKAVAFIFPSQYEGFGLPPLEAMACGCPVIASNTASVPEICGDAALYFDPDNPAELVEKIMRVINDVNLQSELRGKGISRASHFSWAATSKKTWESLVEYIP
ncbi:MAG: glycosyltransferase family 4 protein [Anaerolineales bacterium]|nr:glycosyltransferase family 4 protein [Anaerolineales bacterium]